MLTEGVVTTSPLNHVMEDIPSPFLMIAVESPIVNL